MRRKRAAIVGAVALIALVACRDRRQPDVFISALQPVGTSSAVVIYTDGKHEKVARIESTGRMTWSIPLAGSAVTIAPYNGITVSDDIVMVRYAHMRGHEPTDHALAAFSLEKGALVWDTVLTPYVPETSTSAQPDTPAYVVALPLAGEMVAQWANDGTSTWLFMVDMRTGRIVSKQPAEDGFYSPNVIGTRVIVTAAQTVVYDAHGTVSPQAVSTWFGGCAVADEYVTVTYETMESDRSLVAFRNGDPSARRVIAAPFHPIGHPTRIPALLSCGRYRDRLVLLVEVSLDGRADKRTQVWIFDAQGALLHAIDLGAVRIVDMYSIDEIYPHAAPFSGDLTRFAPHVQVQDELRGDGKMRLVMLDLEAGRIAWSSPANDELLHSAVFRAGERWYAVDAVSRSELSAFDGRTGELVAAVRLRSPDGIGDVWPYHVRDGRVWLHTAARGPSASPSIAVLDAVNLATVFQRGIDLEDATIAVRERLGLVPSDLKK